MEPESSCLIAREVFVHWAKISLRTDAPIIHYAENLTDGLSLAKSHGYKDIYWIWWTDNGTGQLWYGQPIPATFTPIHQEGNIAIYKYSGPKSQPGGVSKQEPSGPSPRARVPRLLSYCVTANLISSRRWLP
jgi:hypothetical protein